VKKVFAMIGRMLRIWVSMFQVGCLGEGEAVEANSAPLIKWRVHTSGLVQSNVRCWRSQAL